MSFRHACSRNPVYLDVCKILIPDRACPGMLPAKRLPEQAFSGVRHDESTFDSQD